MDHLASCSTWLLLERRPFSFGNRSSLATHVAILPSWELIGLEVKSEELPSTLSLLLGRDHGARFEASPQGEMEYSYHLRMELNQRLFRRLAIPLRTRPIREQCPSMASSRRSTCRTASSTCLPSGPQRETTSLNGVFGISRMNCAPLKDAQLPEFQGGRGSAGDSDPFEEVEPSAQRDVAGPQQPSGPSPVQDHPNWWRSWTWGPEESKDHSSEAPPKRSEKKRPGPYGMSMNRNSGTRPRAKGRI